MMRANITITFTVDADGAGEIADATEDFRGVIEGHFIPRNYGTLIRGVVVIKGELVHA